MLCYKNILILTHLAYKLLFTENIEPNLSNSTSQTTTLDRAQELAAQYIPVSQNDIRVIKHCCKSLLFHDNKPWMKKKINNQLFDVGMQAGQCLDTFPTNKGTFEPYKKRERYTHLHTHFFKPPTLNYQTNTKIS